MSDTILVPTADDVIAPVITTLGTLRPNAVPYLAAKTGAYWHPVLGFRGQAAVLILRLAQMAAARRLKSATGTDLLDYVASEFDAVAETQPINATGSITLGRGTDATFPGGVYPKGTIISRGGFTSLGIVFAPANYETLVDAVIDASPTATVTIPIQASTSGTDSNHPILTNAPSSLDQITVPALVANVVVTDFQAGGGSKGPPAPDNRNNITPDPDFDKFVRDFAKAYSIGQYGPTEAATKLGVLSGTGARHMIAFDDPPTGTEVVLVADDSWASSDRWVGLVQQTVYDDDLVGFGCKISTRAVRNRVVTAEVSVILRDQNYLADTTDINDSIQQAVRSYFDDRRDWNVWNTNSLRAAVALAHPKIYQCSSAVVKDMATGNALAEITNPDYSTEQFHYYLASNAMKISYTGP